MTNVEARLTLAETVVIGTFVTIPSEPDRPTPLVVGTLLDEVDGVGSNDVASVLGTIKTGADGHVTVFSGAVIDGGVVPVSPDEDFGTS